MARVLLLLLVLSAFSAGAVYGQTDTDTPTPTDTPTNTPTPTPNPLVQWMLPTTVDDLGTPQPAQAVVFAYYMDAGQVAIALVLAMIFFLLFGMSVIWLLLKPRGQN